MVAGSNPVRPVYIIALRACRVYFIRDLNIFAMPKKIQEFSGPRKAWLFLGFALLELKVLAVARYFE